MALWTRPRTENWRSAASLSGADATGAETVCGWREHGLHDRPPASLPEQDVPLARRNVHTFVGWLLTPNGPVRGQEPSFGPTDPSRPTRGSSGDSRRSVSTSRCLRDAPFHVVLQQHPRLPSVHLRPAPSLLTSPTAWNAGQHPPTTKVCGFRLPQMGNLQLPPTPRASKPSRASPTPSPKRSTPKNAIRVGLGS